MPRCSRCGGKIYRAADVCVSCGHVRSGKERARAKKTALRIALGVLAVVSVVVILYILL